MTTTGILLTCRDKEALGRTYVPALRHAGWAGGLLVVAPGDPLPPLEGLGGVLLAGGLDIHARHWGEPLHPAAEPDEARDALELPLAREACARGLPLLGICRGAQVLNVALGGSLFQHLPESHDCPEDCHRHGSSAEPEVRHGVELDPASRLAALLGTRSVPVNSRHHQAVARVAPGLRAVGWDRETTHPSEGPLVEALEAADPARWVVGVQWHPENLVGLEGEPGRCALALFRGFLERVAARG